NSQRRELRVLAARKALRRQEQGPVAFVRTERRRRAQLTFSRRRPFMDDKTDQRNLSGFDRRAFMAGVAGSAIIPLTARAATPAASTIPTTPDPSLPVHVTQRVNG